ncbi:mpv17-like protein 2 [Lineus longissimus]|uniref:mpv17-like protein 2 n=1 Tax=Lineus longissimus TaxID=88925 RepID=UPI002B4E7793
MLRAGVSRLRPMVGMVRTAVQRYPTIPTVLLGGACIGLGDVAVQRFENQMVRKTEFAAWLDPERSGRMVKIGVVICAIGLKWYAWLDKRFPKTNMRTVVKKVFLDSIVMAPVFIAVFIGGLKLLEGCSLRESIGGVTKAIGPMYAFQIIFWGGGQTFNFAFIPPQYRLLYLGALSMVYDDVLLSYFHHVYINYDQSEADKDKSGNPTEGSSILEAEESDQEGDRVRGTAGDVHLVKKTVVDEASGFEDVKDDKGAEDSNTDPVLIDDIDENSIQRPTVDSGQRFQTR